MKSTMKTARAAAAKRPSGTARLPAKKSPAARQRVAAQPAAPQPAAPQYDLRLYVAGQTPRSLQALNNLKRICEEHLAGKYRIEIIDLLQKPQLAAGDQILAIPTLVRTIPKPARKIIGDLSNVERVLIGLDVRPAS